RRPGPRLGGAARRGQPLVLLQDVRQEGPLARAQAGLGGEQVLQHLVGGGVQRLAGLVERFAGALLLGGDLVQGRAALLGQQAAPALPPPAARPPRRAPPTRPPQPAPPPPARPPPGPAPGPGAPTPARPGGPRRGAPPPTRRREPAAGRPPVPPPSRSAGPGF